MEDRDVSSAFLYFVSGSVAATGINVITGVLSSSTHGAEAFALIIAGIGIVGVAYLVGQVAAIYDHYERLYSKYGVDGLTNLESESIWKELRVKRTVEVRKFRGPILIPSVSIVLMFILREVLSVNHN